eukprot:scaffold117560_cov33-Tisochrysis_lutea.AAC.2
MRQILPALPRGPDVEASPRHHLMIRSGGGSRRRLGRGARRCAVGIQDLLLCTGAPAPAHAAPASPTASHLNSPPRVGTRPALRRLARARLVAAHRAAGHHMARWVHYPRANPAGAQATCADGRVGVARGC